MLAADFCLCPSRFEPCGLVDIEFGWQVGPPLYALALPWSSRGGKGPRLWALLAEKKRDWLALRFSWRACLRRNATLAGVGGKQNAARDMLSVLSVKVACVSNVNGGCRLHAGLACLHGGWCVMHSVLF